MIHRCDIRIRDPFVTPAAEEGRYYLYGTTDRDCWGGGVGFDVYCGEDLERWVGPMAVFRPPEGFWADRQFWAPEVYRRGERWVMFASFRSAARRRGTQALVADSPLGPFVPVGGGPVTPPEWECLDGTLHVDGSGTPWMVFCHEWVQTRDGEMCAVRLTADLGAAAGRPMLLFRASEAPWVRPVRNGEHGVERGLITDGPFLHRAADGGLLMLWSSVGPEGYAVGVARSDSGAVTGPWRQSREPLYARNGGHGMLFRDFAGRLMLAIHAPNNSPMERPVFVEVEEGGGWLALSRRAPAPARDATPLPERA